MDKPNFHPLLDTLKGIVHAHYTMEDLKHDVPSDLRAAIALAVALPLPPHLKAEAEDYGLLTLRIILGEVEVFNTTTDYSDEDGNQSILNRVQRDAEKAFGYYHVLNIHWRERASKAGV